MTEEIIGASFRDPSGYVFERDGVIYRQVNRPYAENYDRLMSSGLYERLTTRGLLIRHEEVEAPGAVSSLGAQHYRTIRPEPISFISYPYEWSFSQLKDAALVTLRLQMEALESGMSLKDASVYNIQFHRGRPIMLDTLSFEEYEEGRPWVAYGQFCRHFLAPLTLMSKVDIRLGQMLRVYIDGIPLDLAVSQLPAKTWLNIGLLMHLRVHSRYQRTHESEGGLDESSKPTTGASLSKSALQNLLSALENTITKLDWKPEGTEWADYYSGDSYEEDSLDAKRDMVAKYLEVASPAVVWDFGANTGRYSRVAAARAGTEVVSFDVDPACVERNYREVRQKREENLLPLLLDLVNPSPAIGWANQERVRVGDRAKPDVILALALIHHIAISNNVPLPRISEYFASLCEALIIEFVPKSDAKVRTLLATRTDIFPDYTRDGFEKAFSGLWEIGEAEDIPGSERRLYMLRRRR